MPVSVIVGGQFGSEGKGKVAHWVSQTTGAAAAVRVGGPNSGHTVIGSDGLPLVFRQLPTAAIIPDVLCVLPAGSYLDLAVLFAEISIARLPQSRLLIDPFASVITTECTARESSLRLRQTIGSTGCGVGAAVVARVERSGAARFAKDEPVLKAFIGETPDRLRRLMQEGHRVVIEGTQGFGLSVLHSRTYPHVTARDTTAAAFVSEAGLSPLDVDDVVLVVRAFPIRVEGNSGPLPSEIAWHDVSEEAKAPTPIIELTSVTHRPRRVARFDGDIVRRACQVNAPTRLETISSRESS